MSTRAPLALLALAWLLAAPLVACERQHSSLVHASEELNERDATGEGPPPNYAVEDPTGRPLAQGDPAPMPAARGRSSAAASPSTTAPPPTADSAPTAPSARSPSPTSASTPARPPENSPDDDPRISRSAGEVGGVIVLWPRVLASDDAAADRQLAQRAQSHLRALAERTLPGRRVEVRPEPERACRKSGCDALALGAVLSRRGSACLVIATVTPPGPVETTLVPMAGVVELTRGSVPFREPPESSIRVRDFADCSSLDAQLAPADEAVAAALRRAAP